MDEPDEEIRTESTWGRPGYVEGSLIKIIRNTIKTGRSIEVEFTWHSRGSQKKLPSLLQLERRVAATAEVISWQTEGDIRKMKLRFSPRATTSPAASEG